MRRALRNLSVLAALATLLSIPASARSATVSVGAPELGLDGPPVIYTATAGEVNQLTVASIPGDRAAVSFRDAGAQIVPGDGCAAQSDGSVACRVVGIAGVTVLLADGDDHLGAAALRDRNPPPSARSSFFAFQVEGGEGSDTLTGADATFSCLRGGPGDDVITSAVSSSAPERALCGPIGGDGDDQLIGGETDDVLSGGPGADSISGGRGDDSGNGGGGADDIQLGAGDDRGGGGRGNDLISGGSGDDGLVDSEGADRVLGDRGDDLIEIDFRIDEGADVLNGGAGVDTAKFSCPSCRVSLNARADDGELGGDSRDNLLQVENLITTAVRYDPVVEGNVSFGPGRDILIGDRGDNSLEGGGGPDRIAGAAGNDRLLGGPGGDRLRAADGEPDKVDCGGGTDAAVVDRDDHVRGCERVRFADPSR